MKKIILLVLVLGSSSVFADWFCDNLTYTSAGIVFDGGNKFYNETLESFCESQVIKPTVCEILDFENGNVFVKSSYEDFISDYCARRAEMAKREETKVEEKSFWTNVFESLAFLGEHRAWMR